MTDFISKKKVLDELIIRHGMNKVELGDSLPKVTTEDAFVFGKVKKIGECKIKSFAKRPEYDYDNPEAIVKYSYIGLYYSSDNENYYQFHKCRHVRLCEDGDDEFNKNTRCEGIEAYDYEMYSHLYDGVCKENVARYVANVYYRHSEKIAKRIENKKMKAENKIANEIKREARLKKRFDKFFKKEKGGYDGELKGFVL